MKNLRTIRTAKGLSQQALADRASITQANVSRIEAGLHDPRYSTVLRLAYGLGVEPEDLIRSPNGPSVPVGAGIGASNAAQ
jgi:transcriptional regulator with XRE-family HTH domain